VNSNLHCMRPLSLGSPRRDHGVSIYLRAVARFFGMKGPMTWVFMVGVDGTIVDAVYGVPQAITIVASFRS